MADPGKVTLDNIKVAQMPNSDCNVLPILLRSDEVKKNSKVGSGCCYAVHINLLILGTDK